MSLLSPGFLSALQRLDIQVLAVSDPFPTGRPDRASLALDTNAGPIVIKFFQPTGRAEAFENMVCLWRSSFGEHRNPPGLPRPLAWLEEHSVLIMERIDGYPMLERMASGVERLEEIAGTLADLHTSDAQLSQRRDARGVVRSIQRKVADLTGTGVEQALQRVADRLAERLPEISHSGYQPVELAPGHGDFSPRNVILSSRSVCFIDWDRFRLADPARDLAYFGAWSWMADLQAGRKPDWKLGDRLIDRYQTYHPIPNLSERIRFYRAAGLARIAHSQVRLWKSAELVAPLSAEALRMLA